MVTQQSYHRSSLTAPSRSDRTSLTVPPVSRGGDNRYLRSNVQLVIVFCAGCLFGILVMHVVVLGGNGGGTGFISGSGASQSNPTARTTPSTSSTSGGGLVVHLHDLPLRPTSHKDDQGRPVMKQQLLEPFVVPRVTGFSVATLQPNQQVPRHSHNNMHEFFYVLKGQGAIIQVNDDDHVVQEGTFVHVAPGDSHAVFTNSVDDLQMLVVGVVIDDTIPAPHAAA